MVARRVELRPITDYDGNRLLRIVRRSSGSVVTWRRAQMVLLAAQAMPVGQIARVRFTSEDRVRDMPHNCPAPADQGARAQPAARPRPAVLDLELARACRLPVAGGVVEDISHEGLRELLGEAGVSFMARPVRRSSVASLIR
jgi:hypothetical protein